jgi:hypothetical protein
MGHPPMADVRAARAEEKVGHSGRDEGEEGGAAMNVGAEAPTP